MNPSHSYTEVGNETSSDWPNGSFARLVTETENLLPSPSIDKQNRLSMSNALELSSENLGDPSNLFFADGVLLSGLDEDVQHRSSVSDRTSFARRQSASQNAAEASLSTSSFERGIYFAHDNGGGAQALHNLVTKRSYDQESHGSFRTAFSSVTSFSTAPRSISSLPKLKTLDLLENKGVNTPEEPRSEMSTEAADEHSLDREKRSDWMTHLKSKGILKHPFDELDWSGRGQHVECSMAEESELPLRHERILGHSANALIDSVLCRRIRLARKKIRCSRWLKRETAINEVQHLQRLQHSHIVRVVGTYTMNQCLSILLYPAADWNLAEFMDFNINPSGHSDRHRQLLQPFWYSVETFLGCLASAVNYMHSQNVKHMDIKPTNCLVRVYHRSGRAASETYKIYLADFGIARAYQNPAASETDSPTPFTRTYAAPEVVLQDTRGLKADIFSLGCVFLEMLAALFSTNFINEMEALQEIRADNIGDISYHANIPAVLRWFRDVNRRVEYCDRLNCEDLIELLPRMMNEVPDKRPTAAKIQEATKRLQCGWCHTGTEPFEAAKSVT
ncbi:kinase-like protein [Polyplosphaeria fusca]|uniref:Kinase-like protein n=1 Tax=Polyplosphaeria fusca TaxID=682080 RepID=A0A9P4QY14_9PLEO|nr:kinase-like protein [Polyplosphaeria fusca]